MVFVEQGGDLVVMKEVPSNGKGRLLHFTKEGVSKVSKSENMHKEIAVGDCNKDPVLQLEQLAQDVFMPLLSVYNNYIGMYGVHRQIDDLFEGVLTSDLADDESQIRRELEQFI